MKDGSGNENSEDLFGCTLCLEIELVVNHLKILRCHLKIWILVCHCVILCGIVYLFWRYGIKVMLTKEKKNWKPLFFLYSMKV